MNSGLAGTKLTVREKRFLYSLLRKRSHTKSFSAFWPGKLEREQALDEAGSGWKKTKRNAYLQTPRF